MKRFSRSIVLAAAVMGVWMEAPVRASTQPGAPSLETGGSGIGVEDIQTAVDQLLAPMQTFLEQIQQQREAIAGRVSELLGLGDRLEGAIGEILGALSLPDPQRVMEEIATGSGGAVDEAGAVNPVIQQENLRALLTSVLTARTSADAVLSEAGQQASATELERMQQLAGSSVQTGAGALESANAVSSVIEESGQVSASSSTIAEQSQSRVSTQDAIKDLNQIVANTSLQLSQLASLGSAQSGQLGGISTQLGVSAEIEASQLLRQQQMVTALAAISQNMADLNELEQGRQRQQVLEEQAALSRDVQIQSRGFRMF